jgi:hypothetical protein
MEPVGVAFAAISLFGQLDACGKSLCRFSRDIRMAKNEVKLLKYEIANCRLLASIFEEVISPIQNTVMRMARQKNLDQRLCDQSKMAHDQIREISQKLKPLYRGKSTGFEKFQAKIRWHFVKDDFQLPMATLGSVKSSLNLLTSLVMLDSAIANFRNIPNSDPVGKSQALDKVLVVQAYALYWTLIWKQQNCLEKADSPNGTTVHGFDRSASRENQPRWASRHRRQYPSDNGHY